jgi:hypothetical protein
MYRPTAHVEPSAGVIRAKRSFSPAPLLGVLKTERLLGAPPATSVVYGAGSDGVASTDHDLPFQCSVSTWLGNPALDCMPVA